MKSQDEFDPLLMLCFATKKWYYYHCRWWFWLSVFLSSDTSDTGAVEIGSIVGVHGSMNAHILNVVEVFLSLERVWRLRHHFAHIGGFNAANVIWHSSSSKITSFLAPERWRVPPINTMNKQSLMVKGRTTYHSNAS